MSPSKRAVHARGSWKSPLTTPNALHKTTNISRRPIQVNLAKQQLLDGDSELFIWGKKTISKEDGRAKACADSVNREAKTEAKVAEKYLSSCHARERNTSVDQHHTGLSVSSRQCALLGLPRSTPYDRPIPGRESTLRIMVRIDALYRQDPCISNNGQ